MVTVVNESTRVQVPEWVDDLASFRRWTEQDDFPEFGYVCFLQGEVWIDMSKEQVFTHGQVKMEFGAVLRNLVKANKRGCFFPNGTYLSHPESNLSVVPDGIYVAHETFARGRIRLIEGAERGYVELEGSPDMTLEVVSTSSVNKDTEMLLEMYWKAGIPEYWLVDARREPIRFDIFRHAARGYVRIRKNKGWLKSQVLGKSFRLIQGLDAAGLPEYSLAVR